MATTSSVRAHITANTAVSPAISAYELFLNDQGRSPYTIKAFLSDLRLMASYFPPDQALGSLTTTDLNNFFEWMQNERGVPCSPKTLARRITTTKSFFRWLNKNGVLVLDQAGRIVEANPAARLNDLICEGASHGVHVIATCDTYNNVNRFLSRKALTEFEMRVLFQMSANDSASLCDTPKASQLGLHRALFYNEQEGYLEMFRPYALPGGDWLDAAAKHLAVQGRKLAPPMQSSRLKDTGCGGGAGGAGCAWKRAFPDGVGNRGVATTRPSMRAPCKWLKR